MDFECPVCKTTKYRNPSMKLLVNVCGHGLCENCVDTLFAKGSGSCPECEIPLKRGNYRIQLFEDASIDKEVEIRRKVLLDFCKQEEDFADLREYNDYLELIEDIVFNLVNGVDVEETKRKIQENKEANRDFITKNRHRKGKDKLELEDMVAEEKRLEAKRKLEDAAAELKSKNLKVENKEKLIDDLMFSDSDAKAILEEHKKQAQFTSADDLVKANYSSSQNVQNSQMLIEGKPYVYEEIQPDYEGPLPPNSEDEVQDKSYDRHIRPAEAFEKAAGYMESMGALRALQEAMSGLYFEAV